MDDTGIPQQQCLSTILNCMTEGVIATTSEQRISFINPAAQKLTGWTNQEALGQTLTTVFKTLEPPITVTDGCLTRTLIAKDDTTLPIKYHLTPLKNQFDEITGDLLIFQDISHHQQLYFLQSAIEQTNDAIMITTAELTDPGPEIVFVNPAFTRMTGYRAEEILGQSPRLLQGLRTDHRVLDQLRQKLSKGQPFTGEIINYRKDGQEYHIQWNVTPVGAHNGQVEHLVSVQRDISARKQAEKNLKESLAQIERVKQEWESTADSLSELICLVDAEEKILRANRTVENWGLGHVTQVQGKTVVQLLRPKGISPDDYLTDLLDEAWQKVAIGESTVCEVEDRFLRRYLRIQVRPSSKQTHYPNQTGGSFAVVVVQDITERKEAEEALQDNYTKLQQAYTQVNNYAEKLLDEIHNHEQTEEELRHREEYFRLLIENASDIITILNKDGSIRYESPAIERVLGYKPNELINQHILDLVQPADVNRAENWLQESLSTPGTLSPTEFQFRHKDHSWRMLEVISTNLLDDPVVKGVVINSRDITERQQLEQRLRLSQKMEAIGQLAGGVAHDFNNILMAITGDCELVLSDLADRDPLRKDIENVIQNAQRGANLTKQLLAFGRKLSSQPTLLDLKAVLVNMDKLLRRLIGEDIELITQSDPELGQIKADAGEVEQMIMNLAINARDAMPHGGKLTIQLQNVVVDEALSRQRPDLIPAPYVKLTVSDTGTGIPEADLPNIFLPFFTTKEVGKGTGLGLSTVHGIVSNNNGAITVHSQLNEGTSFVIYLPRVAEAPDNPTSSTSLTINSDYGQETVLVVEDEDAVRLVIQKLLKKKGYHIITATHGREALEEAKNYEGDIDLLVTDVVMPHAMTGRELADQLSDHYPDLKILFMSGYADNIVSQQDMMKPGTLFLQKPFALNELAEKVRFLLDGG